jgi:hypothetical protein
MNEEQRKILEMLADGKITAEEADRLLSALEGEVPDEVGSAPQETTSGTAEPGTSADSAPAREPSLLERILAMVGAGARYEETLDQELDASGVSLIDAETGNGAITYEGVTQDKVTVHVKKVVRAPTDEAAEAFAQQVQVHIEREGDTIRIRKEHPRPSWGTQVGISYEIHGPKDVAVKLRTSNGKAKVSRVTGAADVVTSNGKVELLDVSGRVIAHTSNGAIEARLETLQDRGEFATSNGAIDLTIQRSDAPINATTSNGAIDVTVFQGSAPITATTSNGAITVTLPVGFAGQLDAATTNGRVQADLPVEVVTSGRTHLLGHIGEGGEALVKLRTANGGIRVHQIQ